MRVKGRHHFLKISLSIFTVALLLFMGLQTIYANPVSIDASGISNNYFSAPGSQQMTPLTGQSHVNNQTQSTSSDTTCKTCSHSNCIKPQNKYPTKSRSLFIHSHSVPAQDASNETNLTFEVTNLSLGMSWNIVIFRSSISLETYISDKFCSPYYAKSTSSTSLSILIPSGTYFYAFGPLNTYFGMYKLYAHGKTEIVNLTLPTLYQVKFKVTNQPTNIDTSFEIVDSFPPPTIEIAYYN